MSFAFRTFGSRPGPHSADQICRPRPHGFVIHCVRSDTVGTSADDLPVASRYSILYLIIFTTGLGESKSGLGDEFEFFSLDPYQFFPGSATVLWVGNLKRTIQPSKISQIGLPVAV